MTERKALPLQHPQQNQFSKGKPRPAGGWDARAREKIKIHKLIFWLGKCAAGDLEMSMSRLRAIEILLRKVLPDLVQTEVKGDITHRYVMQLPEVLDQDAWIKKYGDPKQIIDGTVDDTEPETLQ